MFPILHILSNFLRPFAFLFALKSPKSPKPILTILNYVTIIESTVLWSPLYYLPCPPLKFCPSQIQTESSMMKSLKKLHAFQFLCWYYYKQCYINNFSNMHSNVQVNNSVTTSTTNSCYMCWGPVNCGHLKNSKEPSHFTIIMVKVSYISTLVFELTEQVCNRYVIC